MRTRPLTALLLASAALMCAEVAHAQTSEMYLMAGDQSAFHVIQNGALIRSWTVADATAR